MRFFFYITVLFAMQCSAQERKYTFYTTANGLPSNFIYKCIEDNRGFLWIATDAGVARFDGSSFVIYDTRKGLPDNEVLDFVKDGSGRIWLKIFRRGACYYEEKSDRFISEKDDPELKLTNSAVYYLTRLSDGSIAYNGANTEIFSHDKKRIGVNAYNYYSGILATISLPNEQFITAHAGSVNYWLRGKLTDSIDFFLHKNVTRIPVVVNDSLYYYNTEDSGIYLFSGFDFQKKRFQTNHIRLPEALRTFNISGSHLWASTHSGQVLKLNRYTLQTEETFEAGVTNSVYTDSKGNHWICTVDKGLVKVSRQSVKTIALPDGFFNRNFLSICKWNHKVYAGNYNAQVIETDFTSFITHDISMLNFSPWIRQLLPNKQGLFIGGEGGLFINFEPQKNAPYLMQGTKSFAFLDPDIIVIAKASLLSQFNFVTQSSRRMIKGRSTAVAVSVNKQIYYGSTEGLYHFLYYDTTSENLKTPNPKLLSERITFLYAGKDSLLWAATASEGIFVFKNDSLIAQLSTSNFLLSNSVKHLHAEKPGTVWAATNKGISAIDYTYRNDQFQYSIRNIGTADGLLSPQVNAVWVENDTVYAATAGGINYFSAGITPPDNTLQVYVTSFSVNTRDTALLSNLSFPHSSKNMVLHFAAPELNGSTVSYQYNINQAGWQDNNNGLLELPQLKPGRYNIEFRAVDANGKPSSSVSRFEFTIRPAWWQTWWFISLSVIIVAGLLFYLLQRSNRRKREKAFEKLAAQQKLTDLELQAVKAQINPHFVFNCLNSIKSLIHQQQYDQADLYLDDFSYLLRATIDHSSQKMITLADEIRYIDHYLRLEQLRFGKKLHYEMDAGSLNTSKIMLPSMLLQPYVENAVKHGIRNLVDRTGVVHIRFSQNGQILTCLIDDNGVGMDAAGVINASNPQYHHSAGLSMTGKREELFGIVSKIIDKKDASGRSTGTTVVLEIPLHYI